MQTSPVLALLRRLEAQNIWRMSYNMMPQQGLSAIAMAEQDANAEGFEWYDDASLSARDALRLLVRRIQQEGPVKQRHLQHLYQRCQSPDELEKALKLTRLNYLARGELMQHNSFSHRTSQVLLHEALRLQAPELAQQALQHPAEYGLSESSSTKYFNKLLVYHSKANDIAQMLETYEKMKRTGPKPDSETCFVLVRGLVDAGRCDLAELVIEEFDAAGVRVRNGTRLYLDQHRGPNSASLFATGPEAGAGMGGPQ